MADVSHSGLTPDSASGVHVAQRWNVANAAARAALSLTSADVGGICRQSDSDGGFYFLQSVGPAVWVKLGSSQRALTTFATAVAFDGLRYMPQQTVAGALAFTVNATGAVVDGRNYVRLIADGANTPTFTGMLEAGSSMGYDGRVGVVNQVSFWYDGTDYLYAIMQVVNTVPVAPASQVVRMTNLSGTTESGDSAAGWNYTQTGSAGASAPDKTLPATTDGWFRATLGTWAGGGNSAIVGFSTASVNSLYTGTLYGIFVSATTGKYVPLNSNAFPAANGNANVVGAVGDMARLRRVGSSVIAEASQDAGSTWVTVHTFSGASTAQLFPCVNSTAAAIANNLRGNGLA